MPLKHRVHVSFCCFAICLRMRGLSSSLQKWDYVRSCQAPRGCTGYLRLYNQWRDLLFQGLIPQDLAPLL